MKKKILILGMVLCMFAGVAACAKEDKVSKTTQEETAEEKETTEEKEATEAEESSEDTKETGDAGQFLAPETGETVAEMTVKDHGIIKIRFFNEIAPKAVENFITHAKEGYYDGLTFHRVMNDFMIQGGDPSGNGTGGESIWGKNFEDEFSYLLFPCRGSLCMANAGENTNGSQFFIVQTGAVDADIITQMEEADFPESTIQNYENNGGTPWLWGKHTVFGQVFEGLEIVDAIALTETDSNDKPLTPVVIEKIEIKEY
ncbi:peptidylprolyl isomerase [Anaerobium acetethylicum]|uniref:Peptidyl-prolyl cis-trans isomerase n=1 Tax=Anaerobium acetethylicum TaxID=1619234 RepID=A0A1D3TVF7_9FIRM|nr:peptidylprolyl isomerase [Anaerobium acetethylicum]SCP98117.1 peptidyl-prolyl cis-trans isomerase B (cyclophilin B) [Anaerobium acetethylicum]